MFGGTGVVLHVGYAVSNAAESGFSDPDVSVLPLKQLLGCDSKLSCSKSPLVGLPKPPLLVNVLLTRWLPQSSYRQLPLPISGESLVPPVHGGPLSGNEMITTPQAPLLTNRLFV